MFMFTSIPFMAHDRSLNLTAAQPGRNGRPAEGFLRFDASAPRSDTQTLDETVVSASGILVRRTLNAVGGSRSGV